MNRSLIAFVLISFAGCAVAADDDPNSFAKSSLSHVGRAVVDELRDSADDLRHRTWNVSSGNELTGDWIIETPVIDYWSQTAALPLAERCSSGADCAVDFGLRRCQSQDDCASGICTELAATVTHPGE